MAKITQEDIISAVKEMTVVELNTLVKAIEAEFGVTANAPAAVAAVVEEVVAKGPSEVTLTLKSAGAQKVAVIKAVQAITGLGLMDAKKLVDAAPTKIKEKISPVEAEEHKKTLVAAGAEVEIK
jgi:large subunit ribosomal protein L7/L12